MSENSIESQGIGALKAIFIGQIIVNLVYGVNNLILPELSLEMAQDPTGSNPGYFRWSGGTLLGLAAGQIMVLRNVVGQGPMVTLAAVGNTFVCLALLYSWATEYQGVTWFIATSVVITFVFAVLFWWAKYKYRDIL